MLKLTVLLLLLLVTTMHAQEYYADVTLDVGSDGSVTINGTSNHTLLASTLTQALTTKQGTTWTIALTIPDTFSEYIYTILLPQGAELKEVQTTGSYRITSTDNRVTIIGTGELTPLSFTLHYQQHPFETISPILSIVLILVVLLVGILGRAWYVGLQKKKTLPHTASTTLINKDVLTERQLAIVTYLEKNQGKVTQRTLMHVLALPKASLSRNLDSLEKQGIITKERKGMTMLILLKK